MCVHCIYCFGFFACFCCCEKKITKTKQIAWSLIVGLDGPLDEIVTVSVHKFSVKCHVVIYHDDVIYFERHVAASLVAHRATYVVDGRFFGHIFWKVEGNSAHTHESRAPHVWQLTCTVITIWWRRALTCGSRVAHAAEVWQLTCMVITIWWRGALTCGSHVAINVHSNYYYMVEESPHMWLTCGMCSWRVAINVDGKYYMVEGNPHMW